MEILHILTSCSRPDGLAPIAAALAGAPAGLRIVWHVGYDLARQHVGGQAVKNMLLDDIADGWVWVCDDDNLPAPGFLDYLARTLPACDADGILFAQDRGPGGLAPTSPPAVGRTDIAQVVIRRSAIGSLRIPEDYVGDGAWIVALYASRSIALEPATLTRYNAQRWPS